MSILLKHQPWADSADAMEIETDVEWNMWTRRDPPYHELAVGQRVILVSGGGPQDGMLIWEVEVTSVVKGEYGSLDEAWQLMRTGLGLAGSSLLTRQGFLRSDYTRGAPPAGVILGWTYQAVRLLMLPRPPELRFRPNGWAHLETLAIASVVDQSGGQGRISDPLLRRKVELTAMLVVYEWLVKQGYAPNSIRDTSTTMPFDFEVGPMNKPTLRVEVKGSVGALGPIRVTRGEVDSATGGSVPTVLAVVHSIVLAADGEGEWRASGGNLMVVDEWRPNAIELRADTFTYDPRPRAQPV